MIECIVRRMGVDSASNAYVMVLEPREGYGSLPIWIGDAEAESIIAVIRGDWFRRPLTHDLFKSMVAALGAKIQKVSITHLHEDAYHANIEMKRKGETICVDSRPSDAVAIAIRAGAPIFVHESLIGHTPHSESTILGLPETEGSKDPESWLKKKDQFRLGPDKLKDYLERMRPEDFGKFNP